MALKELTADKHAEAEATPFMRAVFAGTMPREVWRDYTYNKTIFYNAIEAKCRAEGVLEHLDGIERTASLSEDYLEMSNNIPIAGVNSVVAEYKQYIESLEPGKVIAHLYTWHMGDMYGGQMIKNLIDAPHRNLDFDNAEVLKIVLRSKLDDTLADEANAAFDWAIRIMNEYNGQLGI